MSCSYASKYVQDVKEIIQINIKLMIILKQGLRILITIAIIKTLWNVYAEIEGYSVCLNKSLKRTNQDVMFFNRLSEIFFMGRDWGTLKAIIYVSLHRIYHEDIRIDSNVD